MTTEELPTTKRPMRGTAIAWGIINLVIAAIAWFASTVGFAELSPVVVAWNVVAIGGLLVIIAIVAAIVRSVSAKS
jgi:hypothetical protein